MAFRKTLPLRQPLIAFCLSGICVFGSTRGPAQEAPTTRSLAVDEVLRVLQDEGVEAALTSLGSLTDQGVSIPDVTQSNLPAAAAGLFRSLSQLSTDEQYELLLKWSLPTQERRTVRLLTTPVPVDGPPKAFARAIGERPRDTSFPIADVGDVRGLFCSGWMLVQAAEDVGRLSLLVTELEKLSSENVSGAKELWLLAQIADRRSDTDQVQVYLTEIGNSDIANNAEAIRFDVGDLVSVAISAAALSKEALRPQSELALQTLAGRETPLRPLLRVAHATAVQINRGQSPATVLYENRLKHWVPVTGKTAVQSSSGVPDAMWLTHEDHVLHLAGGGNDVLFCRYPLTGEFDFVCETQEGGDIGTDGGLVYGGLHFEALGRTNQLTVSDADGNHPLKKPCPFVRHEKTPTFNRVSIRAAETFIAFESNFHPMWFDGDAAKTSPWLGLRSDGMNRPAFRNLRIQGAAVIPRQVQLIDGDQLRGWESGFFGESQMPFSAAQAREEKTVQSDANWQLRSHVLVARTAADESSAGLPSLLRYQRPLLEDESISYEFEHGSGAVAIHPAVGRLVFLLHPEGVQVRWITDGKRDWTGLSRDHTLLEPLSRRGPKSLPLKADDWNLVKVNRADGKLNITLNDQLVYQRALDFDGATQFGFYREARSDEVRIRSVVMTGDWPEQLPQDFLKNPVTLARDDAPLSDRRALGDCIGEEMLASNVHAVRRQLASTAASDRFEALCDWVLPSANHGSVRMTGLFVPTHASPAMMKDDAFKDLAKEQGADAKMILSPVYDLLDIAKQDGKLEVLHDRIESIDVTGDEQLARAKVALRSLVGWEIGHEQLADQSLVTLRELIDKSSSNRVQDLWLELTTAHRTMQRSEKGQVIGDLISLIHSKRVKNADAGVDVAWQSHLSQLMSLFWIGQWSGSQLAVDDSDFPSGWLPTSEAHAATCGSGRTTAQWVRNRQGEVMHLPGHDIDFLYFQSPLRGRYTIEADITETGTIQAFHSNEFCGPGNHSTETIEVGSLRQSKHPVQLERPFDKPQRWIRYRIDVTDDTSRVFLNGRMVRQQTLSLNSEPWFAFRAWWNSRGDLRDVSISGSPTIPDEVALSNTSDLNGWLSYDRVSIATDDAHWRWMEDQSNHDGGIIVGERREDLRGSDCERLLQYHRPLFEDGSIELEFYYKPGETLTSPALGRLAFVFQADGVYEHWVTDGKYDRTLVRPDNLKREQANQRGGAELPLIADDWNRVRIEVAGATLQIRLNDSLVYERTLPATLEKKIGLFQFADRHESRVRKVVMRGDWPKQIPSQDLADPLVASLDERLPELVSVYKHDFRDHAETDRYIHITDPRAGVSVSDAPEGKLVTVKSPGNWVQKELSPRFSMQGDFDVEASFSSLASDQPAKEGSANLSVRLNDKYSSKLVTTIGNHAQYGHFLRGQLTLTNPDGTPNYVSTRTLDESDEGRLRIARRGEHAYFLFAQADSSRYRVVGQQAVSAGDVEVDAIQLLTIASGVGQTDVIWNDVTVRAEKMKFLPSPKISLPPTVSVMDVSTGRLREIAEPTDGYTHLGSAEWSPDGKQIAYDQSTGSTTGSRVMIVEVEGANPIDIGYGSMPTFSADGSRIAFSAAGEGVGFMNVDGLDRRIIDRSGWGIQWSPDGKKLAYSIGGNILLWDVATESKRTLMTGQAATQYDYLYWNMSWSRDSSRIVFKGRRRGTGQNEVAVVSLQQPDHVTVLIGASLNTNPDFSWSLNDGRILFSMVAAGTRDHQLFLVPSDGSQAPALLENQPTNRKIMCGVWSPDGLSIAITGAALPTPVDWPIIGEG